MIIELQKAFKHIQFFNQYHQYVNLKTGEKLESVTKHIEQFQPKFDKEYWLKKKAAEKGISPEELDAEWQWKSKISVEMGSCLHAFLEQKIQRRHIIPQIPDYLDKKKFEILIKQAEKYIETLDLPVVACEFVMCNKDDSLAGMADSLLLGQNGLVLRDYKTGQLKDSYGKFHNAPYEFLPASSLGKYALQLNHYRSFLEDRGFPVESMQIVWFNENNPSFEIHEIEKFEII